MNIVFVFKLTKVDTGKQNDPQKIIVLADKKQYSSIASSTKGLFIDIWNLKEISEKVIWYEFQQRINMVSECSKKCNGAINS